MEECIVCFEEIKENSINCHVCIAKYHYLCLKKQIKFNTTKCAQCRKILNLPKELQKKYKNKVLNQFLDLYYTSF